MKQLTLEIENKYLKEELEIYKKIAEHRLVLIMNLIHQKEDLMKENDELKQEVNAFLKKEIDVLMNEVINIASTLY